VPIINGPFRDPEGDDPPRRRKAPKALVRMRRELTYEKRLSTFNEVYGRAPASEDELDAFVEEYIRDLYNSGHDEP
jgi:hypothetical protein